MDFIEKQRSFESVSKRKKILRREEKKAEKRSHFSNILIVQKKLVQALLAIAGNDLTSLIETRN